MGFGKLSEQEQGVFLEVSQKRIDELGEINAGAAASIAASVAESDADNPEFDEAAAKEAISKHLKDHPDELYPYIVRGARLCCRLGSHIRKLNLPTSHGIYTGKGRHPLIHAGDAVPGKNIMYFGHCSGTINASGAAEEVDLEMVTYDENYKAKPTGSVKRGYKCKPKIIGGCWTMTHRDTQIVNNGQPTLLQATSDSVTGASFLVCAFGGLIEPLTSRQENTDTDPIG